MSNNVDALQNEGSGYVGREKSTLPWIISKCDSPRDDRIHTSVSCGRWEFNGIVTSVLALNIKYSPSCLVKVFPPLLLFQIVSPKSERYLLHVRGWKCACMCCMWTDGVYRCSIIQSISLGFKALTEN